MKTVELFLGRMQPIHLGHKMIIEGMTNPVVVLVKGGKTSKDKARNPLGVEYQQHLLELCFPGLEVSVSPNGFLPGILGYLRNHGKEVKKIYAGADRIASYKIRIEEANKNMKPEDQYQVVFQETPRYTSATAVRTAIREGDYDTFRNLTPKELLGEWDNLRSLLTEEDVVATTVTREHR